MPVTIKDIARKAGVSHATVSRSLNGNPNISERTAAGIRDLATEMGYIPSAAARGLKTNRSHVLGVIVSRIDNPYFGEIVQGIEDALQGTGYSLFFASTKFDQNREKAVIQAFGEHRVDGIILGSVFFRREYASLLTSYDIPVVVINNQSRQNFRYSVAHDDEYGARQITRHLLELGHTHIYYLGNARSRRINRDRSSGFKLELEAAGVLDPLTRVMNMDGSEIVDGSQGISLLLERSPKPTAVFCFNDLMAIGALKTLHEKGMRVPEDISIAGFDDIAYSAYTTPALTTFHQPKLEIGAEAAGLLLELIHKKEAGNGHEGPLARKIRGELLVRESTGPLPPGTEGIHE